MRLFAVVPLIVLCGCPKKDPPPPPVEPAKPVAQAVEDDCTFDTKLVPGVPGSPGHLIASERNPNGDSELAAHMRTMVDDLKDARAKVLAGQPVAPLKAKHRKIRCAWPTSLSDRTPAHGQSVPQERLRRTPRMPAQGQAGGKTRHPLHSFPMIIMCTLLVHMSGE